MKVLIACEESQTVCKAFRAKGHEAYSCDIQKNSGGVPGWHILMDALAVINGGTLKLETGQRIDVDHWDLIIAHPPCTYLTNAANRHHSLRMTPVNQINARTLQRINAMGFFMRFVYANCDRVAIENPVGVMNTCYRSPDQIIHPYMFAKNENDTENYVTKATCLWLKGLEPLKTNDLPKPDNAKLFGITTGGKVKTWTDSYSRDGVVRSKTFLGIARAMAEQWG